MRPQRPISRRRGFTILELALSVMVMSTLMVAMGSAVLLASKAIPAKDNPANAAIAQSRSLDMLTSDLAEALYFNARTATTLAFTVPDRDGDGNPERIRYAWSGTAGDPLTRQLGQSSPQTVVPGVDTLVFTPLTEATIQTLPPGLIDGVEQVVASYVGVGLLGFIEILGTSGLGESFKANQLPAGTVSWKLTGVETRNRKDGSTIDTLILQVRPASPAGEPLAKVLAETSINESALGFGLLTWTRVAITADGLDPKGIYAFVFFNGGAFEYQPAGVVRSHQAMVTGSDAGGWIVTPAQSLTYRIYGMPKTIGTPYDFVREHVTAIDIDLQGPVALRSRAMVPNSPQIVSRYWDLNFEHDPTGLDVNADDTPDWATKDALLFDGGSLAGGVWSATQTLVSSPSPRLDTPLTVSASLRDTTQSDGSSAEVLLAVDRGGLAGADLRIHVELIAANQQQVTLLHRSSAGDLVLATKIVATTGFVDVLATVVPANDLVNLRVNGEDIGTFQYQRFSTTGVARIEISTAGGVGAQFQDLVVRANP